MIEMTEKLARWLSKLLPQQKNSAPGGIQIGQAGGNVTVVNNVFHVNNQRTYGKANTDQRAVLQLMRALPDQGAVLAFMEREFGTRMVIELPENQLYRLRRYVETIHKRASAPAKTQPGRSPP